MIGFVTITTPITLMVLVRAALFRDGAGTEQGFPEKNKQAEFITSQETLLEYRRSVSVTPPQ